MMQRYRSMRSGEAKSVSRREREGSTERKRRESMKERGVWEGVSRA